MIFIYRKDTGRVVMRSAIAPKYDPTIFAELDFTPAVAEQTKLDTNYIISVNRGSVAFDKPPRIP